MTITVLITTAQQRGATIHTTSHADGALAVVQVLALAGMTTWPLPVDQAAVELGAALK